MADRFEDLRTLLTVISAGGVNAAAAELGIAKSAVSRRISDLERRIGAALVDRSNRRFELTAVGAEYARRARAVLTSLDELDASVEAGPKRSAVRLGASSAILTHAVVPALTNVRSALADPRLVLHLTDEDDEASDITVSDREPKSRMTGRPLFESTLVLCASPGHIDAHGLPREPRDLDGQPAIVAGDGPAEWLLRERFRPIADLSFVSRGVEAGAAAAIAGLGLAQLPDYVAAAALADGRLVQVLAGHEPAPVPVQALVREDAGPDAHRIVDALATALGGRRRPAVRRRMGPGRNGD